jgi:hypothetical protein
MIRFVHLFNYAEGISKDQGEEWYLGEHVPEAKKLPGVKRYISWLGVEVPHRLDPMLPTPADQFVRRSELWFDNLETALESINRKSSLWKGSGKGGAGFREFECLFLDEAPQYDLLKHAPPQHYKYMTLPLNWTSGAPKVEEPRLEDFYIDTYFLFYGPDVSSVDGEEWYLGHHTREGKQFPGMKHYKTWKAIAVPEAPQSSLKPNKWYRLTELGVTFDMFYDTMIRPETRIRFTPSPLGNVIGGWGNIFIKLDQREDFLAG